MNILHPSLMDAGALASALQSRGVGSRSLTLIQDPDLVGAAILRGVTIVESSFVPAPRIPWVVDVAQRSSRVFVLAPETGGGLARAAMLAGAQGVFSTSGPIGDLARAVGAGHAVQPPRGTTEGGFLWQQMISAKPVGLTVRELQIVTLLLLESRSVRDVAGELRISVHTVKNHLANVRKKLPGQTVGNLTALKFSLEKQGIVLVSPKWTSQSG